LHPRWEEFMVARNFLCTLILGFSPVVILAAAPPQVENRVPVFPLGEEYREAWPPQPVTAAPAPKPGAAKPVDCEMLLRSWLGLFGPFDLLLRSLNFDAIGRHCVR
jgi:hypothetical protein